MEGVRNNITANAICAFKCEPNNIMAWIGPAISQRCYEVDTNVASRFSAFDNVVQPSANQGKFLLDLPAIAEQQLQNANVFSVTQSALCTYSRQDLFYSHRFATHQNKRSTGRIVSVIGLS
jgi:copper oxidase (laccase) domain-containing protein